MASDMTTPISTNRVARMASGSSVQPVGVARISGCQSPDSKDEERSARRTGGSSEGHRDDVGAVSVGSDHGGHDDIVLGVSVASENSVGSERGRGGDSGEVEGVGVGTDDTGDVGTVTGTVHGVIVRNARDGTEQGVQYTV